MRNQLDVLLLESHPGVGADSAATLEAAGHRVSCCVDPGASDGFPCRGVSGPAECPVAHHVDVALLVRRGSDPAPTALEQGVNCAIRAGIPVVEDGPDLVDPYTPFLTSRVESDAVQAIEAAAAESARALRSLVIDGIGGLLDAGGLDRSDVGCEVSHVDDGVRIDVSIGQPIDERTQQTLAVRVFDVLRDRMSMNAGKVDINVVGRPAAAEGPPA